MPANAPPSSACFRERFCEQHGIRPEKFTEVVLLRSLYPHAKLIYPLLKAADSDCFAADFDLIRSLEGLRRMRDFNQEIAEHRFHPANVGAFRHTFKFRVSISRLRRVAAQTLHN